MQFLHDIRRHVSEFGSQATDEIHRFLDFLVAKYESIQPKDAVVAPVNDGGTGTPVVAAEPVAAAVPDAPVAEASPADDSAVPADAGGDDAGKAPAVAVLSDSAPAVGDESAVVTSV